MQQEESLRLQGAALEAAADAIIITDRQGQILWLNPAFSRLTGYTAEGALGKNPRDLVRSGKHEASYYQRMWGAITAGSAWHSDIINRRKDGSLFTEALTITPMLNAQGTITHFMAIKRDVTTQRHVQRQVMQQERLAAIGQMAAGIAPEIVDNIFDLPAARHIASSTEPKAAALSESAAKTAQSP